MQKTSAASVLIEELFNLNWNPEKLRTIVEQRFHLELLFLLKLEKLDIEKPSAWSLAFLALVLPSYERNKTMARRCADVAEAMLETSVGAELSLEIAEATLMLCLRHIYDEEYVKGRHQIKRARDMMGPLGMFDQQHEAAADFVESERKRRILWTLYVLVYYLGCGDAEVAKYSLSIQLPCQQDFYELEIRTMTRMLRETREDYKKREEQDQSTACPEMKSHIALYYIESLDFLQCCTLAEAEVDIDAKLSKLSKLPRSYQLRVDNTEIQLSKKRTSYVLLHSALMMCKLVRLQRAFSSTRLCVYLENGGSLLSSVQKFFQLLSRYQEMQLLPGAPIALWACFRALILLIWWFAFHSYADSIEECQRDLISNNFKVGLTILCHLQEESNLARVLTGKLSKFLSRVKEIISDSDTLPMKDVLEETLAINQCEVDAFQDSVGMIPDLADLQSRVDWFNIKRRANSYGCGEPSSTPSVSDTDHRHESGEWTRDWNEANWPVLQHFISRDM
ncbi:hypothetical protein SLS60_011922 [Paraconiothyrium brasiliense]|uniref:Transcription factor domain-containing protein n=1 Tax=Paraconiothyrium brasiliense TaxID=300254 RepID=A0ABR3QH88_9PLEO